MTFKKSKISNLLWAAFTIVVGVVLANYSILIWQNFIYKDIDSMTVAFVFAVFLVLVFVYILLKYPIGAIYRKIRINNTVKIILSIIILLATLAYAVYYRVSLLWKISDFSVASSSSFYERAVIGQEHSIPSMVHGASYLYTIVLSLVLKFIGNKVIAGIYLQIVFEIIACLLAYLCVKDLAGRKPAIITAVSLAVSNAFCSQIFMLKPEAMYFCIYLLGLLIVVKYLKNFSRGKFSAFKGILYSILIGLMIGALTYLDLVSATLLIFTFGLFTVKKEKVSLPVGLFIIDILGAAGGLLALFCLDGISSGNPILNVIYAYIDLYSEFVAPGVIVYENLYCLVESYIWLLLAFLLVMSFWNKKDEQSSGFFVVLMLLLGMTPMTLVGCERYQCFAIFAWSALAGIGLSNSLIKLPKRSKDANEETDENQDDAVSEEFVSTEENEDKSVEDNFAVGDNTEILSSDNSEGKYNKDILAEDKSLINDNIVIKKENEKTETGVKPELNDDSDRISRKVSDKEALPDSNKEEYMEVERNGKIVKVARPKKKKLFGKKKQQKNEVPEVFIYDAMPIPEVDENGNVIIPPDYDADLEPTIEAKEKLKLRQEKEESVQVDDKDPVNVEDKETVKVDETKLTGIIEKESDKVSENSDSEIVKKTLADVEKKVEFIKNPLPVPKKHEKKDMDYGFNVNDSEFSFDFDVNDDDDFDLQ